MNINNSTHLQPYLISDRGKYMEPIYTISSYKQYSQSNIEILIKSIQMNVFFGSNEGKNYAVLAEYQRGKIARDSYRRHNRSSGKFNVYYRRNFYSKEEGNQVYLNLKKFLRSLRKITDGMYEATKYVTVNEIIDILDD